MFLSKATNTVDGKGRVSVPAEFRMVVSDTGFDGIFVWPSLDGPWLEGGGLDLMQSFQASLDRVDHYDEGRLALQEAIFGSAHRLSFDSTGRISLPKTLQEAAGLSGKARFVGLGRRFEIWNPDAHDARQAELLERARAARHLLKPVVLGS